MSWHTLLSNIGGQLGLWLGLSAASLSSLLSRSFAKSAAPI